MPNQLVIKGAGIPGAPDSYYSELKTLSVAGSGKTLVPEIGWILPVPTANMSYVLLTDDTTSPPTYTTVEVANTGGALWSDGTNLFIANASTENDATYFVLAFKP